MPIINNVDFPQPMLDAIANNNLVVFAGAGVSFAAPTNLMSFKTLSDQIASGTGKKSQDNNCDVFLGKLEHDGVKVHKSAAQILRKQGGEPNNLHKNLIRLFFTSDIRIVTTNFDQMFECALESNENHTNISIYSAPALPLGKSFQGIVHIHGDINHDNDMIMTDLDFGRAYLTEGWARRFLVDVFLNYTILFIGYSYNDTVMKYLTRAIPVNSDHAKYILIGDNEDKSEWKYLNIEPIIFDNSLNDFKNLYNSIDSLAKRMSRGILDWNQRMRQIALDEPPRDVEAVAEFLQAMNEIYLVKTFTDTTHNISWFSFMVDKGLLDTLCKSQKLSEQDNILLRWCVNYFLDTDDGLLRLLATHSFSINKDFANSIARALYTQKNVSNELFSKWISVLFGLEKNLPDDHYILQILQQCVDRNLKPIIMLVFSSMIHIEIKRESVGFTDILDPDNQHRYKAYFDITTETYFIEEVWKICFRDDLSYFVYPLFEFIYDVIEQLTIKEALWDSSFINESDSPWNRLNLICQRIDGTNETESYHSENAIFHLISMIRECMVLLCSTDKVTHLQYCKRLMSSKSSLLRRLGIFSLSSTPLFTPNKRVQFLMDNFSLVRTAEKAEIHLLLQKNYPELTKKMQICVINRIHRDSKNIDNIDNEYSDRRIYEWVHWLLQVCPEQKKLLSLAKKLKIKYPKWIPSEHPELFVWSSSFDYDNPSSPITLEELLYTHPTRHLEMMVFYNEDSYDGPNRDGLKNVISKAIQKDIDWSLKLAQSLINHKYYDTDLWDLLLQTWRNIDTLNIYILSIIPFFEIKEVCDKRSKYCADILLQCIKKGNDLSLDVIDAMHVISVKILQYKESLSSSYSGEDRLIASLDSTVGVLSEFWLQEISILQKTNSEWHLTVSYKTLFLNLIDDSTDIGRMARPILCSNYLFLSTLDHSWCKDSMLPLFSSVNNELFLEAWEGFLTWGRIHISIAEEIGPQFEKALDRYILFNEKYQKYFTRHFTLLMIYYYDRPLDQLIPQLFSVGGLMARIEFAHQIDASLQSLSIETIQILWSRWLKEYWEKRILQIPIALDTKEINIMIDWLQFLNPVFSEAVDIAIQMKPTDRISMRILHNLKDKTISKEYPNSVAKLLQYLAPHCSSYEYGEFMSIYDMLNNLDLDLEIAKQLERAIVEYGISILE